MGQIWGKNFSKKGQIWGILRGSSEIYFANRYFHFSQAKIGHSLKKGAKMGQNGAHAPYMESPINKGALWEPCSA